MRSPASLEKQLEALEQAVAARRASAIPERWQDFEQFALECRTRQAEGLKGLKLYDWQKSALRILEEHGTLILAKSRQVGGSQVFILKALQLALTKPGFLGLIATKNSDDVRQLARRVRRSLKNLETPIRPVNDSLSQLVLNNESQLLFRSSNPSVGLARGIDNLDFALCDEYSFWTDGQEEALGSLGPAMANTLRPQLIIVSTPHGKTDDYYKKLTEGVGAREFERRLERIRNEVDAPYQEIIVPNKMPVAIIHWKAIPAHAADPEAFKQKMTLKLGLTEEKWLQEFDLSFTENSSAVFPFDVVQKATGPAIEKGRKAAPGARVLAGIDSCGVGRDYAAMVVIEELDGQYRVLDIYRKQTGTAEQHLSAIALKLKEWGVGLAAIETNSMGQTWLEMLSSVPGVPRIEGVATTSSSKPVLIGRVGMALDAERLEIPEASILKEELLSYQQNGNKMEAAYGSTDDVLMALAMGLSVSELNTAVERMPGMLTIKDDPDDLMDEFGDEFRL